MGFTTRIFSFLNLRKQCSFFFFYFSFNSPRSFPYTSYYITTNSWQFSQESFDNRSFRIRERWEACSVARQKLRVKTVRVVNIEHGSREDGKSGERFILSGGRAKISVKREIGRGGAKEEAKQGVVVPHPFSGRRVFTLRRMSYVHGAYHKFNMPSGKAIWIEPSDDGTMEKTGGEFYSLPAYVDQTYPSRLPTFLRGFNTPPTRQGRWSFSFVASFQFIDEWSVDKVSMNLDYFSGWGNRWSTHQHWIIRSMFIWKDEIVSRRIW